MKKQDQEHVFVTDDKAMHQGGILSSADKEILESVKGSESATEGMITIESVEQLAERFEDFKQLCSPMEIWQARIIRVLRVKEKRSWRAIAEVCYNLGWGKWEPPSNQIMGMALCETAAQLLGENYEEAPWN